MDHKYGELNCNSSAPFSKTIIPLVLVGYEIVIADTVLHALLGIYHLISNAHL